MFPFRDANPSNRFPIVTVSLIIVNVLAFVWELRLGPGLEAALLELGVVPQKWFLLGENPEVTLSSLLFPYFSSVFLHGGWFHLIGNMWWLWIFGDNVEDELGHFRYLLFYLACGVTAGVVHTAINLNSALPAVGASGAVAGILGAYLILYPHAEILTLIPLYPPYFRIVEIPALFLLIFWFMGQFLNGTLSIAFTASGGVAWWAHVGGFLAGIAFLFLLKSSQNEKSRI